MIEHIKTGFNRRKVIGAIGLVSLLPVAGLWYSMVNRIIGRKEQTVVRILRSQLPEGVSYHDLFIIIKNQNDFIVYSTSCTHLGCKLKLNDEGRLVCPCHGSVFNLTDGNSVRGPAIRSLEQFEFSLTDSYIEIITN